MQVNKIMVAGAGQMGHGIAQVAAQAGFTTYVYDVKDEFVQRGTGNIRKNLDRQVEKGKLPAETRDAIAARLIPTTDLNMAREADVVIEAIPEDMELKKDFFRQVDAICPPHTVLASNTSAIPITKLAAATDRPGKVAGMHFMNPVPVMQLVEIVEGNQTSPETLQTIEELATAFGKVSVKAKDYPGFLSTRLVIPFINEALYSLYEGRGTLEDIEKCAKLGLNHPMGPFEWLDFVGLDSILAIMQNLYQSFGDTRYFPCPLLVQMVQAGRLGRKVGRGFYEYSNK
ncbi:MAG: 3-hydroxybutyryl-CoA dehydrogenase [Clostridia bacterium]|nr:MAG: 3-hydroxybutyryl-CoA dehydrogenase [Clostridia bacterium]